MKRTNRDRMTVNPWYGRATSAAVVLWALSAWPSPAHAGFMEDFESDTPGQSPSSGIVIASSASAPVDVVSDSDTGTPDDPFGGTGNQSLRLEDADSSDEARIRFPDDNSMAFVQGKFSTRFYLEDSATFSNALLRIKLGDNQTSTALSNGETGPYIDLGLGDSQNGGRNTLNGENTTFDNTFAANAAHTLVVNFDAQNNTWTGTIDGDPITADNGNTTTFNFRNDQALINQVEFISAYSSADQSRAFVDDVQLELVPEPGSAALFGLGGLLMLSTRSWNKMKSGRER